MTKIDTKFIIKYCVNKALNSHNIKAWNFWFQLANRYYIKLKCQK